ETLDNTKKLIKFVSSKFENDELNNDSLVQLIELCGSYLNLQDIPTYAKNHNLSYNGVKKFRCIKTILNKKFVIDND
ncbi:unnamed protein product, partial [marine sediment metagenome]